MWLGELFRSVLPFSPEQVCGKKDQFKASVSSQPHTGGAKNVLEHFSFDNVKIFLVNKNV
jgi:hypothetical protein